MKSFLIDLAWVVVLAAVGSLVIGAIAPAIDDETATIGVTMIAAMAVAAGKNR